MMGRPPIWDDPEAFADAVEAYFQHDKQPTWSGLALYLGFESRQSLDDYKKKDDFSYPIKKALLRIEQIYEQNLSKNNPAGSIFALKNFGWQDKQTVDSNSVVRLLTRADPGNYPNTVSTPGTDEGFGRVEEGV